MDSFHSARALMARLGIRLPIVQAPMAGVSTADMAAAVTNAGALGSIGIGTLDLDGAAAMIAQVTAQTAGPFNVNVFCHSPARRDPVVESSWLDHLRPEFERLGATPPAQLAQLFTSFVEDESMLRLLVREKPAVVSFHFGLPPPAAVKALHDAGSLLLGTATRLEEASALVAAGVDVIVAQGYEAGGHRGMFDPDANDECLGTAALTSLLVRHASCPVISAGGIMDGAGIAAALRLGAGAAQLGTAFLSTKESCATPAHRARLASPASAHTVMTRAVSGRPARMLANRLSTLGAGVTDSAIPVYPLAYDAARAMAAAAQAAGETGFGAHWAGQAASLSRSLPAAALVAALARELAAA